MNCPIWPGLDDDLTEDSLVPPLGTRKNPVGGKIAILVSTASDLTIFRSKQGGGRSIPFFNSALIHFQDRHHGICVAGPYIGAPYAAMILESLIARGAEKIIVLGWCGGLSTDLRPGDVVVPDSALVHEGTSGNYQALEPEKPRTRPSNGLTGHLAEFCRGRGLEVKNRTVWTTDAIYRETSGKAIYFRESGAAAVEMECSALFSVAAFRRVEIAALLIVSDILCPAEPGGGRWQPAFRDPEFKKARHRACDIALDFAGELLTHVKPY